MADQATPYASAEELAELQLVRDGMRAEAAAEVKELVACVEDVTAGGVPARLYRPNDAPGALLFLHGGGFALGDLVSHDGIARRLVARTGWAVLMPDYRLAPEHAWPAADEDSAAAGTWLAGQDFDRLVVVGDSAGATLALGEALRSPARYAAQVLVYPFVDPSCASYAAELDVTDLSMERCEMFWRLYLQGADASADPALGALDGGSLTGLPPTLIQLAEADVLTRPGRLLADRLRADGVEIEVELYPGVQHGFWRRTDNDQAEPALARVAAFLASVIG
ncbi:MAG: alpha/beta hydrolase [Nocardioides sp.]